MQVFRVFATLYLVIKHVSLVFVSSTGECCHSVLTCWYLVLGGVTVFLCFLVVFLVFWLVVVGIQWFLMLGSGGSGTPQEKFPYESTQLVTL